MGSPIVPCIKPDLVPQRQQTLQPEIIALFSESEPSILACLLGFRHMSALSKCQLHAFKCNGF